MPRVPAPAATGTLTAPGLPARAVLLLAAVLPFEAPLFAPILGQTITSVEAMLVVVLALSFAAVVQARQPVIWRTPLTLPIAACVAAAVVAATLSPVDQSNA